MSGTENVTFDDGTVVAVSVSWPEGATEDQKTQGLHLLKIELQRRNNAASEPAPVFNPKKMWMTVNGKRVKPLNLNLRQRQHLDRWARQQAYGGPTAAVPRPGWIVVSTAMQPRRAVGQHRTSSRRATATHRARSPGSDDGPERPRPLTGRERSYLKQLVSTTRQDLLAGRKQCHDCLRDLPGDEFRPARKTCKGCETRDRVGRRAAKVVAA